MNIGGFDRGARRFETVSRGRFIALLAVAFAGAAVSGGVGLAGPCYPDCSRERQYVCKAGGTCVRQPRKHGKRARWTCKPAALLASDPVGGCPIGYGNCPGTGCLPLCSTRGQYFCQPYAYCLANVPPTDTSSCNTFAGC